MKVKSFNITLLTGKLPELGLMFNSWWSIFWLKF